ncbi:Nif3-like dinuclear metal center hexameric protein [Lipingzhangella sp. LS1_29]|uniref:GTP cyclohydrolase 1 type 2 homolog n=1 Tax=Lipingzhangella rawalii TaxID=2055835 RepID=A0ABU2H0I2_9ACTN|nr:Nif3-like dinuclear metal center hexameric protein [Lipingzhangella rawalii]MDS1268808.1 Nif3-like dinuclear metal center hexameric protein [Lipingzhangella rawalii]
MADARPNTPTLASVRTVLERSYDPAWAASWDAVGLVCGAPEQPVGRVLFAVDVTSGVVDEAMSWGADLIVAHHPLLLRGVNSVAADTPKGALVHRLIRSGIALYTAHTNADVANPGVSDALASAVGLSGQLRPLAPDVTDSQGERGLGRVGELEVVTSLGDFAEQVVAGIPATAAGVRVAGDARRPVRRVAVSGGAGDSLLEEARAAGVDVFVTSDLRHHPATEFVEAHDTALIDTPHWASEWPWLPVAAAQLSRAMAGHTTTGQTTLETRVSTIVTDAWHDAFGMSRHIHEGVK